MSIEQITRLMSNSECDAWTDIYDEARISNLIQIPLSVFLRDPWAYLLQAGQDTAMDCVINGHKPQLSAQVRASASIPRSAAEDASDAQGRRLALVISR